jgi:hypothetical protein
MKIEVLFWIIVSIAIVSIVFAGIRYDYRRCRSVTDGILPLFIGSLAANLVMLLWICFVAG